MQGICNVNYKSHFNFWVNLYIISWVRANYVFAFVTSDITVFDVCLDNLHFGFQRSPVHFSNLFQSYWYHFKLYYLKLSNVEYKVHIYITYTSVFSRNTIFVSFQVEVNCEHLNTFSDRLWNFYIMHNDCQFSFFKMLIWFSKFIWGRFNYDRVKSTSLSSAKLKIEPSHSKVWRLFVYRAIMIPSGTYFHFWARNINIFIICCLSLE